jgi:uncharacterized protein (TIGR02246 family)
MRKLSFALATCLLCSPGFAQTSADEKAVRAVIQKMDDAWNAHDYTYSGKYAIYTPDAVMINPVGMYWRSRAEIIKAHQVFGETMFRYSSSRSQPVDIRFLVPTVALVTIKAQYVVQEDHNLPDGSKAGSKGDTGYNMVTAVLTRKNDSWKIASLQVTELNQAVQKHNPVPSQAGR